MARYYPGHPKWKYKMGRKAWLKLKQQRKKCKELFVAGNHYAQRMAERCKTIDELKKLVLKDLQDKNGGEMYLMCRAFLLIKKSGFMERLRCF